MTNLTKALMVFFILLIVATVASCSLIDKPIPTPTPVPTPTLGYPENQAWYNWWNFATKEEWPSNINGQSVCYVRVGEKAVLQKDLNDGDGPSVLAYPSEVDEFGNTTRAKRTIASEDKWLMVYAAGNIWNQFEFIENDSKTCRPFKGDGGNHVYLVMEEQIVDGHFLIYHPDNPLYVFVRDIVEEYQN